MPVQPKTPSSSRLARAAATAGGGNSSLPSDFVTLTTPKRQAIVLIYGDSKSGKTSFGTRFMPDPIALINFDRRAKAAALLAQSEFGKTIHFLSCDLPPSIKRRPPEEVRLAALDIVDRVNRNLDWAAAESLKGNIRTIILDTASEYSDILKYSFDGIIGKSKEGSFGQDKRYVKRHWWDIFNLARDSNAHLLITARGKEVWRNNKPTGVFIPDCPAVIMDGVDFAGWVKTKKTVTGKPLKEFELMITSAGENIDELGKTYDEDDWEDLGGPFVYSCLQQYVGSDMEDWE